MYIYKHVRFCCARKKLSLSHRQLSLSALRSSPTGRISKMTRTIKWSAILSWVIMAWTSPKSRLVRESSSRKDAFILLFSMENLSGWRYRLCGLFSRSSYRKMCSNIHALCGSTINSTQVMKVASLWQRSTSLRCMQLWTGFYSCKQYIYIYIYVCFCLLSHIYIYICFLFYFIYIYRYIYTFFVI